MSMHQQNTHSAYIMMYTVAHQPALQLWVISHGIDVTEIFLSYTFVLLLYMFKVHSSLLEISLLTSCPFWVLKAQCNNSIIHYVCNCSTPLTLLSHNIYITQTLYFTVKQACASNSVQYAAIFNSICTFVTCTYARVSTHS